MQHRAGATMVEAGVAIEHGGGLLAARTRFPAAPMPWMDLSTGINPVAYPVPALPPAAFGRLPEPEEVARLEAAAARAYGVPDPAMVVAAPGTQILISLLPRVMPLPEVAILGPTYAEHLAAWAAGGAAVSAVTRFEQLGRQAGAVLCNPNNPDGRRIASGALVELASRLGPGRLVVDEAFADLEDPGLSLAPIPPINAVVLRSFGKTYGLAGLRLGFLIAAPGLARAMRTALGPWAVSGPAVAIGTAALADAAWRAAARDRLTRDAARLDAMLVAAGMEVVGGTRLFRLGRCPDAATVHDRLCRAGILARRFADRPDWLRFGIPACGWERLQAALQ